MDVNNLKFPVLCFNQGLTIKCKNVEELTTCTKTGLKNGYFKNLQIVDSSNKLYKVKETKKIKGVGLLWGYNIFLNQKILVDLIFHDKVQDILFEEVKNKVLNSSKSIQLWETREGFDEFKNKIASTKNINELANLIK